MKINLELFSLTFISFGITLPVVMGTLGYYHKHEERVKLEKHKTCLYVASSLNKRADVCEPYKKVRK